jgi:hypothetical protein
LGFNVIVSFAASDILVDGVEFQPCFGLLVGSTYKLKTVSGPSATPSTPSDAGKANGAKAKPVTPFPSELVLDIMGYDIATLAKMEGEAVWECVFFVSFIIVSRWLRL